MIEDGEIDDTFNIHFLKLSASEQARNLALAKEIPFARTNDQLKEYEIPEGLKGKDSIYQLLDALKACSLKNDALMDVLYEQIDFLTGAQTIIRRISSTWIQAGRRKA